MLFNLLIFIVTITSTIAKVLDLRTPEDIIPSPNFINPPSRPPHSSSPITVVILNYHRPDNIGLILQELVYVPAVSRIVISHGREDTFRNFTLPFPPSSTVQIVHRKDWMNGIDKIWGVGRRFIAAIEHSETDAVLFLDDDILIPAVNLQKLIDRYHPEPYRIHGIYGAARTFHLRTYEYMDDSKRAVLNNRREASIVLTQCSIVKLSTVHNFITWIRKPEQLPLLIHLQQGHRIVWNGEDIVLALFTRKFYNHDHISWDDIDYFMLPSPHAISNSSDHYDHRTNTVRTFFTYPATVEQFDSEKYWDHRYSTGGDSGIGSYFAHAEYKAEFLNNFFRKEGIRSVLDFGVGDGNVLSTLLLRNASLSAKLNYTGLDISPTILANLRPRFPNLSFHHIDTFTSPFPSWDCTLSYDVIFHLINGTDLKLYADKLFGYAKRYVIVYATNIHARVAPHVYHRPFVNIFLTWYPDYELFYNEANPSQPKSRAEFFLFRRKGT